MVRQHRCKASNGIRMAGAFTAGVAAVLVLSACQGTVATRGNMPDLEELAEVTPGSDDRDTVLNLLGTPSSLSHLRRQQMVLHRPEGRAGCFLPTGGSRSSDPGDYLRRLRRCRGNRIPWHGRLHRGVPGVSGDADRRRRIHPNAAALRQLRTPAGRRRQRRTIASARSHLSLRHAVGSGLLCLCHEGHRRAHHPLKTIFIGTAERPRYGPISTGRRPAATRSEWGRVRPFAEGR